MTGADRKADKGANDKYLGDPGRLSTESVRPELGELDLLDAAELVGLMLSDARRATDALSGAAPAITAAVELVRERLASGGRLVYVGAGTAGRLAVLDAAELGPTFSVPDGIVTAVLAGGEEALRRAVEGAEDDGPGGAAALQRLEVGDRDAVIGVSASGRTAYVIGALEHARSTGAGVISISCNTSSPLRTLAEVAIELLVGGEVVAGSSRLNAGTAQKIALNTISTAVMVLLGKTYGNLMVDLRPTNAKLRNRAVRIVRAVTGVGPERRGRGATRRPAGTPSLPASSRRAASSPARWRRCSRRPGDVSRDALEMVAPARAADPASDNAAGATRERTVATGDASGWGRPSSRASSSAATSPFQTEPSSASASPGTAMGSPSRAWSTCR